MGKKGRLFIISAPSGTGKTTILNQVMARDPELFFSVSYTTRPSRENEKDGIDYRFISEKKFKDLIDQGALAEWTEYCGAYYGTGKKDIEEALAAGKNLVLDVEVEGGTAIKRLFPDAVAIFLVPPSIEELTRRLKGRKTDSEEDLVQRLAKSKFEMTFREQYDYCVINDEVTRAVREVVKIISAAKQ
jgi:guanylate kinase